MRVLLIALQSYMPSGYRAKLRWLAQQGGVELSLVTMQRWAGPTGLQTYERSDEPFGVRFVEPSVLASHPALRVVAPGELRTLIEATQPDIVHVEAEPHALLMLALARLKQRLGFKLVGFSWENIRRRGKAPLGWIEPYTLRQVDAMVVGNHEGVGVIRWRGFDGPVTVIPQFGFDPEPFAVRRPRPAPLADDGASFRVAYVGRLVEEKGIADLLAALPSLPSTAHLYLLGSGPQEQSLRQKAATLGLAQQVHLLGGLPHDQVIAWMQHVDALVLPSRTLPWWKEQFGRVLVEAMLSNTVVVGSDSGAIPEVIGDAGLLFPEGDTAALARCLCSLSDDHGKRESLASIGRERARTLYSSSAIGQATLDLYRQVMARQVRLDGQI